MKEVKCPDCGHWNEGQVTHCAKCDFDLYHREREEEKDLARQQPPSIPLIQVKSDDHFLLKVVKFCARGVQMVFWLIVTFIAYISASTCH